jgi:hypothetical protein
MAIRSKVLARSDRNAQAQNAQVSAHAKGVRQVPTTDGRERIGVVVPAAGSVVVVHKLGRRPKGYSILTGNNNAITDTARTSTTITFANSAGADATISVWIF